MAWASNKQRGTRHQRGYGRRWEKLRAVILRRDDWLCQPCMGDGRVTAATEVDHIVAKAHGGTDKPDNLQSICHACHKDKTAHEGQAPRGCDVNGLPLDPDHPWRQE